MCVPDIFSWTFGFLVLNVCHLLHALYVIRPIRLNPELESVFIQLFRPLGISRLAFKKLVSSEYAEIFSLHTGETYALQNITRTDRLSLLLTGKVTATFIHQKFLSISVPPPPKKKCNCVDYLSLFCSLKNKIFIEINY